MPAGWYLSNDACKTIIQRSERLTRQ